MKESPLQQALLKLKSVFPEAVTETKQTDDDGKPYYIYALKDEFIRQLQEVGLDMADDQNRYELQFPGKQTAKATAFTPCYKTLIADKEQSKNFDDTGNVFIEGDNLDALRMLQNSYRGKIKMIYIDPPYNTGGDDFVYPDDFSVKQKEYLRAAGVLDEDGVRQISEIQTGLKGRFHAGWLAFMYPRLKLARELLSDDGVIFISIDDNEQANLKLICDEIFGEDNFVALFSWMKTATPPSLSKTLRKKLEYVLCYKKNVLDVLIGNVLQGGDAPIINKDNSVSVLNIPKETCLFKTMTGFLSAGDFKGIRLLNDIEIVNNISKQDFQIEGRLKWTQKFFDKEIANGTSLIVKSNNFSIRYIRPGERILKPANLIDKNNGNVGTNEDAGKELDRLGLGELFSNPKPISLIKYLVNMSSTNTDLILDFFAGSATTAHAVMQLNAEDSGNRKFILVQLPEEIKPEKFKEAHQFCTKELKCPATIAEIAKERIRRAGKQVIEKSNDDMSTKDIDAGFRAFVIRDSLLNKGDNEQPLVKMEQTELKRYMIELKRENFEPLLYEALLKTGVTLNLPLVLDEIDDYPFAICDRRCYCVTENLTQQVVQGISEKHSDAFDILYYLSDALNTTVSYTEIEAVIHMAPGDKQIQGLTFY